MQSYSIGKNRFFYKFCRLDISDDKKRFTISVIDFPYSIEAKELFFAGLLLYGLLIILLIVSRFIIHGFNPNPYYLGMSLIYVTILSMLSYRRKKNIEEALTKIETFDRNWEHTFTTENGESKTTPVIEKIGYLRIDYKFFKYLKNKFSENNTIEKDELVKHRAYQDYFYTRNPEIILARSSDNKYHLVFPLNAYGPKVNRYPARVKYVNDFFKIIFDNFPKLSKTSEGDILDIW